MHWNVVTHLWGIYLLCKSKVTIASEILIWEYRKLFLFNFMISKDKRISLCCIKSNMSVSWKATQYISRDSSSNTDIKMIAFCGRFVLGVKGIWKDYFNQKQNLSKSKYMWFSSTFEIKRCSFWNKGKTVSLIAFPWILCLEVQSYFERYFSYSSVDRYPNVWKEQYFHKAFHYNCRVSFIQNFWKMFNWP